jgi:branched-chain amino acid transport system ATP-binding protein
VTAMLEVQNVTKTFGELYAVKNVSFKLEEGEILGLIGPNGAGKTTLFNCISGMYPLTSGKVLFKGADITGLTPDKICRTGISRTFQLVRPFLNMSALDNVIIGALYGRENKIGMDEAHEEAMRLLKICGLEKRMDDLAKNLTMVDRKMIELARALATDPELLLIDELIAGLNEIETEEGMKTVKRIRDELGITVFWVEHVMKAIMGSVDRIVVIHHGEKIAMGTPKEISSDQKVIDAYLGEKYLI